MHRRHLPSARTVGIVTAGIVAVTSIAACSTTGGAAVIAGGQASTAAASGTTADTGAGVFDSSTVHSISVDFDQAEYDAIIAVPDSGDKNWISATVTIDGVVFENAGIKLKGNSSLGGLRATEAGRAGGNGPGGDVSADEPAGLPWRIRLDKFVDGQNHQGETDIVVRGNRSETSLNEAVALDLIGAAGLPTEQSSAIRFSVNGSSEQLRLLVENPGDDWYSATVGSAGILYKAEAGGDYSYRGDDPASYQDVFDVEANTSTAAADEYAPLIAFLEWLNESDDATFAAELSRHLDVDSFADYLAVQDLVNNFDDIDGPGNNSYLSYDETTGLFTVIAWDQNLSFGEMGGAGAGGAPGGMMRLPDDAEPPAGGQMFRNGPQQDQAAPTDGAAPADGTAAPQDAQGARPDGAGGPRAAGNVLAEKFLANADFAAAVQQSTSDLAAQLYASGRAQEILDAWVAVLEDGAADLVSADTIDAEAAAISEQFTA